MKDAATVGRLYPGSKIERDLCNMPANSAKVIRNLLNHGNIEGLQELTDLHSRDITFLLKSLVEQHVLVAREKRL